MSNNGNMAATEAPDTAKRYAGDELRQRGRDLADTCNNHRAALRKLGEDCRRARTALSEAVAAFMAGVGPNVSDAKLRRDYLASAQAEREAAKGVPVYAQPVANSFIDRAAQGTGDANTFVRKQMHTGHRRAAARFVGLRGSKLPSSR